MKVQNLISTIPGVSCALFIAQMVQSSALAQATVTTDQEDYAPYSVVWITGGGFEPGETVSNQVVQVTGSDPGAAYEPWSVVADTNGNFETSWLVFSDELIGSTLELTAVGQTSGYIAKTQFTDGGPMSYVPSSTNLTASAGGSSVSFLQIVIAPEDNDSFTTSLQVAGSGPNPIPDSWVSTSPTTLSFTTTASDGDTNSWTVSFTVPAGTPPGTYTANIKANPDTNGVGVGPGTAVSLTVNSATPPTITCPANITVNNMPGVCTSNVTFTVIATGTPAPTVVCTPASGSAFPAGTTTVLCTASNSAGTTNCSFTVTVVDNEPPVAPTLTDATGECSVTVSAPTTADNCAGTVIGTTSDALTYTNQGTFTVHWSFNDGNGNTNTADQTVIVDDVTAPEAPTIDNATGECSVTVTAPTAPDNCVGNVTGTTADPLIYTNQGTFTVHWSFNDGNGNTSTADQTVIVDDVTAPEAPTIDNATGECSVTVTAPTAPDNCVGNVTGTTADPLIYTNQGTFTVHWSFNDGNGNTSTADQTVIVDDVTAPEAPTIDNATGECTVTVTSPIATDNCVGNVTGTTADALTYTNQGTFTVHWSFNDGNGNTNTADQTVIVDDVTAPEAPTIDNATGECSVTVTAPIATDNCVGNVTGTTADPLIYTNQGTFTVHWSFNDGNGNTSAADQTVIVDDVTAPAITCPDNVPVPCSVDAQVPVTYPDPSVSDNCNVASVTAVPASGSLFPVGTTTVTCTVMDNATNITTCSFTVTRSALGFDGFLPPIGGADATGGSASNTIRTFKLGSTIPFKFSSFCEGSPVTTGIHTLQLVKNSGGTDVDDPVVAVATDAATIGNQFRLTDSQWHFNLSTKSGFSQGTWRATATLSDGSTHVVWISLKK